MSGLVGFPPISVSPPECLFEQFQLDLRSWLKMLLRRLLWVEAQIHYPLGFGRVRWYIFSLGTPRSLTSFNCRSPI